MYREFIQTVALAAFLVLLIQSAVQNYRVDGPSMEPLLHTGERVAVSKLQTIYIRASHTASVIPFLHAQDGELWHPFGELQRGDVVVFRYPINPAENYVKRVIGLPGDRIRFDSGTVFVNGVPLDEPYVDPFYAYKQTIVERTVPAGEYFVLGDNRRESYDSREWGYVPADDMIGKVIFSYWPPNKIGVLSAFVPAL